VPPAASTAASAFASLACKSAASTPSQAIHSGKAAAVATGPRGDVGGFAWTLLTPNGDGANHAAQFAFPDEAQYLARIARSLAIPIQAQNL
jgi:hypothetical protein